MDQSNQCKVTNAFDLKVAERLISISALWNLRLFKVMHFSFMQRCNFLEEQEVKLWVLPISCRIQKFVFHWALKTKNTWWEIPRVTQNTLCDSKCDKTNWTNWKLINKEKSSALICSFRATIYDHADYTHTPPQEVPLTKSDLIQSATLRLTTLIYFWTTRTSIFIFLWIQAPKSLLLSCWIHLEVSSSFPNFALHWIRLEGTYLGANFSKALITESLKMKLF